MTRSLNADIHAEMRAAKRRLIARHADHIQTPRPTKPARKAATVAATKTGIVMARVAQRTRFADPALVRIWKDVVGEEFASLCRPGRMSGGRANRTFEVCTPNGAAATAVTLKMDELKERLNAHYGPGTIGVVKVRQTSRIAKGQTAKSDIEASGLGRFRGKE